MTFVVSFGYTDKFSFLTETKSRTSLLIQFFNGLLYSVFIGTMEKAENNKIRESGEETIGYQKYKLQN